MKRLRKRLKHWKEMRSIYRDRWEMYKRKITDLGELQNAFRELLINNITTQIVNQIPSKIQITIKNETQYDIIHSQLVQFKATLIELEKNVDKMNPILYNAEKVALIGQIKELETETKATDLMESMDQQSKKRLITLYDSLKDWMGE